MITNMDTSLYVAKIQAEVLGHRDEVEKAYDRYPDATQFWGFIDLSGSSNYRIANGPKEGYLLGETFFTLIRTAISSSTEVRLIKEIGDEVFVTSSSFRPMFESMILIGETARQLSHVVGSDNFPFALRSAIGFGPAKRLMRSQEDFIGTPIDQLARIMNIRSQSSNLLIHEEAYRISKDIITEYDLFANVSDPIMLPDKLTKSMSLPLYYREVLIDGTELLKFRGHFEPWKSRDHHSIV